MTFLFQILVAVLILVLVLPMLDMIQTRNQHIGKMEKQLDQLSKALDVAGKERMRMVNDAVADYFRETDYDAFRARIESVIGIKDHDISRLEADVNAAKQQVLRRMREQLPELPEDDIHLICYIYAGLSYQTIRLLTDESLSNLYSRKSRLVRLIESSHAPDKAEFLTQLKK